MSRLRIHKIRAKRELEKLLQEGFDAIVPIIEKELKDIINESVVRRKDENGRTIVERSKPGEPPRKDSGDLQSSISVRRSGNQIRIIGKKYGGYLEEGTRKIKPRPWLSKVLIDQGKVYWSEKIAKK